MKPFSYIAFILMFSFLVACDSGKEAVDVQKLNQDFIGAWNSKDSEKVIAMMGEDVQFLQGEMQLRGKSEVSNRWVRETINTINNLRLSNVSSSVGEDLAYGAGTFTVDVLPAGPEEPHGVGEGNYVLIWKKGEDGEWKLNYAQLEDMPVQARNF
ncbi:nuclear transport factor 2 family protein [uncultured Pontibacter sp.]|uniref:YybH family protein n=1 Tax=uncultured Pontibacter sp. TaxID=453356 RepID=UPI002612304F|nr:nuclear transport factor 2 family protein [uncultured Pontibacter sp.]